MHYSNGNVWAPGVKAYVPTSQQYLEELQQYEWHDRERVYDKNAPANFYQLHADAIYRVYQLKFELPIASNQDLKLNIRGYSVDGGYPPYSLITSDDFIEWLHTNVIKDEDPFDRKLYGYNKTDVRYTDLNGDSFKLSTGNGGVNGFEGNYTIYPDWKKLEKHFIYTNFSAQIGINTGRINPTIDAGLSSSIVKSIPLKGRYEFNLGLSLAALRQGLARYDIGYEIATSPWILSNELMLSFGYFTKRGAHLLFASTWWRQSAFNTEADFDRIVLTGPRVSPHWHTTLSHLYRVISANNFICTYQKSNVAVSVYLREDFKVDNAPDAQTGIEIKLFIP